MSDKPEQHFWLTRWRDRDIMDDGPIDPNVFRQEVKWYCEIYQITIEASKLTSVQLEALKLTFDQIGFLYEERDLDHLSDGEIETLFDNAAERFALLHHLPTTTAH